MSSNIIGMKKSIIIWVLCSVCAVVAAQVEDQAYQQYYFEGNEVVFEFDTRYYKRLQEGEQKARDFADLDIYEVAVAGNFNEWEGKKWKMKKIGPTRYQLRKKIKHFDDPFKWEFKFIINGVYWAVPQKHTKQGSSHNKVRQENNFWKEAYGEYLYPITPNAEGNARFFLPGHEQAKKVILTGSFNGWDEQQLPMQKTENGWEIILDLSSGMYEYKFIVDGQWMEDPTNPNVRPNQYNTLNSILELRKEVTFWLEGYEHAKKVFVAGSFNDWDPKGIPMHREGNTWLARLNMDGGKHLYKFVVDGQWINDPANPLVEHDGYGHINNVMVVD